MLNDNILDYINDHSAEAYDLLLDLCSIPAPSGMEHRKAVFISDWLISRGANNVYIDDADNVIYHIAPAQNRTDPDDEKFIVFAAHSDTVFPEDTDLTVTEKDGRVYCPGIGDDNANAAALLMAAAYIAENDIRPEYNDILIVIDSGEEGLGNLKGMRQLVSDHEGRINEFIAFDAWNDEIVHRSAGSRRYRICVDTPGGHSYLDRGRDSAIEILSRIIVQLYDIELPDNGTSVNAGVISGGTSVNAIAQHAEVLFEYRAEKEENSIYMRNRISEILNSSSESSGEHTSVTCSVIGERPCMGNVDENAMERLISEQCAIHEKHTGRKPVLRAGSTDCNITHSIGIPSICIGCFSGGGTHTTDEYVEKDSLVSGYRIAFETVLKYFRHDLS